MPKAMRLSPMSSPEDKKHFDHALRRIMREDDLINYRLGWLIASQTIFLGTYILIRNQLLEVTPGSSAQSELEGFALLILVVALLACIFIYLSIVAAIVAIRHFRKPFAADSDLVGPLVTHFLGLLAPITLPVIFMGVWVFFLIGNLPIILTVLIFSCLLFSAVILR